MDEELKQLLTEAKQEIQQLRRRNEILGAKVEVFDSMMCLLHSQPPQHVMGGSPDVCWLLQNKIDEVEIALKDKAARSA